MPGERVSMRKIRDVLRLRFGHCLAQRSIGQSLRLSQGAINEYLKRAHRAGLGWPLPDNLDDAQLEALLFPPPPDLPEGQRPVPDWSAVHREMRRPNVTLALLWDEYRTRTTDGFGYSCYVAARLMWRRGEKDWFPRHEPQHNFDEGASDYRPFRNVISDGSGRCQGFVCRSEISTRASAFAFNSMSTSA